MEILTVEKFYDDKLWVITVHESNRAAVDAWEACVRDYIATVPEGNERFLVYDTTVAMGFGLTTYLQNRATALAKDNREATGRIAIVLNISSTVMYLIESFLKWTGSRIQPDLDVKLFQDRTVAIEWVSEIIPTQQ